MKCKMKNRAKSLSILSQSRSDPNINEKFMNIINQDLTKSTLGNNPYDLHNSDVQKFLFQNLSTLS